MFERILRAILISISFLLPIISYSQGLGNSPYSSIGIGDVMNYTGGIRNIGMGNAGSAFLSKDYMNQLNPAGLANLRYHRNDSLVKLDVGYTLQYKFLTNGQASSESWGANIKYLAFSFPVSKIYSTSISLTPFTSVQNYYSYTSSFPNTFNYQVKNTDNGNGGIYQFQWANGFGITKNLSVGLSTIFNFGTINQESTTQLITDPNNPNAESQFGVQRKTNYSGVSFKPGIIYSKHLSKQNVNKEGIIGKQEKGIILNIGATAELYGPVNTKETKTTISRNLLNQIVLDSVTSQTRAPGYLPSVFRLGIGLEKTNVWTLAADFSYMNWSNYKNNQFKTDPSISASSFNLCVGAEHYIKNQLRTTRSNTIRAGFMYSSTPLIIDGHRIYDYSFSIGASLPVGVKRKGDEFGPTPRLPILNVAFVVGQRGNPGASDVLTETYYRLQLGMSIYNKWFNKRRIQ